MPQQPHFPPLDPIADASGPTSTTEKRRRHGHVSVGHLKSELQYTIRKTAFLNPSSSGPSNCTPQQYSQI